MRAGKNSGGASTAAIDTFINSQLEMVLRYTHETNRLSERVSESVPNTIGSDIPAEPDDARKVTRCCARRDLPGRRGGHSCCPAFSAN